MVRIILLVLALAMTMLFTGCSSKIKNYEFGNISKAYCQSENKETRSIIKAILNKKGVKVGVDYCALRGFVGAVVHNG